jgi:hypothetical protein
MEIYTKEILISKIQDISNMGWIKNVKPGNSGGIGNTLEYLLGIEENNLPIPNASEWELKCQRIETSSLTTLFHMEPSPRALKFVPQIFLLKYGWPHKEAGIKYSSSEMSFRQTINGKMRTDRGFMVIIDRKSRRVLVSFDYIHVDKRHSEWLESVKNKIGIYELNPQPYWGFDDLCHKAGTKLLNCFYVQAETKKEKGIEYFHYKKLLILEKFDFNKFLTAIEDGNILIDFDARTGHNHGTKFRLKQNKLPELYSIVH